MQSLVGKGKWILVFGHFFAVANSVAEDVKLDRLDKCEVLAGIHASLLKADFPTNSECRPALGPIETSFPDWVNLNEHRLCFLKSNPYGELSELRCFRQQYGTFNSLICYRERTATLLQDYQLNYKDKYASKTNDYLGRARQCGISSGDAARRDATALPRLLQYAGKQEFGFSSTLGKTKPYTGLALHGFASTSPRVAQRGVAAFEYFEVSQSTLVNSNILDPGQLIGKWRVKITDEGSFNFSGYKQAFRKAGVGFILKSVDVDIRRDPIADSYSGSESFTKKIFRSIAADLANEEFTQLSEREIIRISGIQQGSISEAIKKLTPYGDRISPTVAKNMDYKMWMKESGEPCAKYGDGAFGAFILRADGPTGQKDNYGSIGFIVFGLGDCAKGNSPQRRYIEDLVKDAKENVLNGLPNR